MGDPLREEEPKLEGRRLGRYLLRYLVARGGMGSVYLAQLAGDHGFEKWVAVKVIHPHLVEDPRVVSMFLDEARLAARIGHPNVCHVTDFGKHQGVPYLVLEYLHGESFASVLKRAVATDEKLPPWIAARVVADAARGLHAAHQQTDADGEPLHIVHRDVSPQNLFVLYSGAAKVIDFGIARAKGRMTTTRSGELKGKLAYMSPEQLAREEIDARADIWALGVVLWEALTCKRLFRSESEAGTLMAVLQEEISEPWKIRDTVPTELSDVAMRMLVRNRDDRIESASTVADLLERWLYSSGEPAGPAQIADWMRAHFADKRATRDAMLQAPELPFDAVPEVELDAESSGIGRHEAATQAMSRPAPRLAGPRSPRLLLLGAVAVVVTALAIAGAAWFIAGADRVTDQPVLPSGSDEVGASTTVASPEVEPVAPPLEERDAGAAQEVAPLPVEAAELPDAGAARARPGRLSAIQLHGRPGGHVFVDGRRVGGLPLRPTSIAPGRHRVELRVPGRPAYRQSIRVRPGRNVSISIDCRASPCVRRGA